MTKPSGQIIKHFVFDLTCDIKGRLKSYIVLGYGVIFVTQVQSNEHSSHARLAPILYIR